MANDGTIRLVTYPGSTVSPLDDAVVYDAAIGGSGVMHGCDVEMVNATQIRIAPGHGVIRGRKFTVIETLLNIPPSLLSAEAGEAGNVLIVLDLSGGDVPPIYFEAHTPREEPTPDDTTTRAQINPNYDSTQKWKLELCTYQANSTGLISQPTFTAKDIYRVTRIKNASDNTYHSGELTLDKNWIGLGNVEDKAPNELDVRSAKCLYTPMQLHFYGDVTEKTVTFDGRDNIKNPSTGVKYKNPTDVELKINFRPSNASHTFVWKPIAGNNNDTIEFTCIREGAIVLMKIQSSVFTYAQWKTMDTNTSANGYALISQNDTALRRFTPDIMVRETTCILNSTPGSQTYWVRFSISQTGHLTVKTNAPNSATANGNVSANVVYRANDRKWNWS